MAELISSVFPVSDSVIVSRGVFSTKSIMPLDGDLRVWYGEYSGTASELKTEGMLIPETKLLEHVNNHDGVISLISATGTITVHEVK